MIVNLSIIVSDQYSVKKIKNILKKLTFIKKVII